MIGTKSPRSGKKYIDKSQCRMNFFGLFLQKNMIQRDKTMRSMAMPALFFFIFIALFVFWFNSSSTHQAPMLYSTNNQDTVKNRNRQFSQWPEFSNKPAMPTSWYFQNCFGSFDAQTMKFGKLYDLVQHWSQSENKKCQELFQAFDSIFTVTQRTSQGIIIPDTFMPKFLGFLNNNKNLIKEAEHQTVTYIFNEFTREETMYNPLREKRPISKPKIPEKVYVDQISKETEKNCDFCSYKQFTAADPFGRIESKYAYTASNAFKYDAWHSLLALKTHHPTNWTQAQILDMFNLGLHWINKVHSIDPRYKYSAISWDMLPHSGASQVHPHTHISMTNDKYYGVIDSWKISAEQYFRQTGRNYFSDLTRIHDALGLAVHHGTASALAYVNPKKDDEIIVIGRYPDEDFFKLLFSVVRTYLDVMEKTTFSSIIALPQLGTKTQRGDIPAYARLVTRGPASSVRSDVSSLELFLASNVNIDPFKVIKQIKLP